MLAIRRYLDRIQAGQVLAEHLPHYASRPDVVILALPRGGVPVGVEVARVLHAPLDIFLVRKLGMPGHEELAMGAIASGGVRLLNTDLIVTEGIPKHAIETVTALENAELKRREAQYRSGRTPLPITGRIVIIVDDGLATGFSMRAALKALRARDPGWLCAAVPVGAPETCEELADDADEVICPLQPSPFQAVGLWYDHFAPTTDDEVIGGLEKAARTFETATS